MQEDKEKSILNKQKITIIRKTLELAQKNVRDSLDLLNEMTGEEVPSEDPSPDKKAKNKEFEQIAQDLNVDDEGKVIEGVFNGQNMIGPDDRMYPVPANYASKSKLVEGDILKLTIQPDGSFVFKQIGPIERKKIIGTVHEEDGEYHVLAENKKYKVLLASITYFKAEPNDEVTIIVPQEKDSTWAAIENVIKKNANSNQDKNINEDKIINIGDDIEEI